MNKKVTLAVNSGFAAKKWVEPEQWIQVIVEEMGCKEIQCSFDLFYPNLKETDSNLLCH